MIRIREVAKLAEVSPSTVSRVLNGTAKVNEEKRQRVEKVIKETGFKPNEAARTLFKKSAHIIGVIVPNIENPFFNEMAKAIEAEAYRNGYRLTLCNSSDNLEKEKNNINLLDRMNADGIILLTNQEDLTKEVKQCKIPVITLDRQVKNNNEVACVQSDHYGGGRMAMEYLISCGCKHIINMQAPQELSSARARYQGYLDVCRERKVEPCSILCQYQYEDGLIQTEKLLQKYPEVDGILAANDMVAISVYKVLHKHGLKVPNDIQIIGFDNINLSSLMTPEITTIAQPISEMGTEAVQMLLKYLDGKEIQKQTIFPVELIVRETTKNK
ncbi:MAG: LacI family DNA-binding transcriptional regulator [Lachnospiraceae bacterium]